MIRRKSLISRIGRLAGDLHRDRRGNVAIIVAFAMIPLVGALGLATDTGRGYLLKARLSQALDAAALAGSKVFYSSTRDDDIRKFFNANFPPGFMESFPAGAGNQTPAEIPLTITADETDKNNPKIKVTASAGIPTTFMRVLGFKTMDVPAAAEATRTIKALDVVLSLDMSGSMEETAGSQVKIVAARDASIDFVDTIFQGEDNSPTLDVDGKTYDLLHIGFVPWNSKVRVTVQGNVSATAGNTEPALGPPNSSGGVPQPVTTSVSAAPAGGNFTNPITGQTQSVVYYGTNSAGKRVSPVPLLMNPATLPGGWSGCVYARYLGDSSNTNDADTVRGSVLDDGTVRKAPDNTTKWPGYEPMAVNEAEPRSSNWGSSDGEPSNTRWSGQARSCTNAYVNDSGNSNLYDNQNGTIKNSGTSGGKVQTSRPVFSSSFPNSIVSPATTTGFRSPPVSGQYSGTYKFWADTGTNLSTTSYAQPGFGTGGGTTDCTACLTRGIIPLTTVRTTINSQLSGIKQTDPDGNTNLEQGLFWAWEVLSPGLPFDQALPLSGSNKPPFPRTRAIVIMTDGEQVGGNGDAYKGRFGSGAGAGTNTQSVHGNITYTHWDGTAQVSTTSNNNLNARARQLADNIKAEGVVIYVIAFNLSGNQTALDFLKDVASFPKEEHFFNAPSSDDLKNIFDQIAASLTTVHLSM